VTVKVATNFLTLAIPPLQIYLINFQKLHFYQRYLNRIKFCAKIECYYINGRIICKSLQLEGYSSPSHFGLIKQQGGKFNAYRLFYGEI
jgi:hypothetical protein